MLIKLVTKYKSFTVNSLFILILVVLVNGRSLLGLYIFGFRLAELLTGLSIFLLFLLIYKNNYFRENLSSRFIFSYLLLVLYFFIFNFINSANFLDLYIYKSSVYIWYISFMFFGFIVFKNIEISKNFFYFGYLGLLIQFMFNVIYYPDFLTRFFNEYSDKTQFLKGAEIAIFFIVVTFFANKFANKGPLIDLFVLTSSIYVPLIFFKSRSAAIALFAYIFVMILRKKNYFFEKLKKSLILLLISIVLFLTTSHFLVDNTFEVQETPDAVAQVFKHKYIVSNTYDDEVPLFYIYEGDSGGTLEFNISDIKDIRKHLYKKINKPIYLINCRIFIKNKNNEVILISPIKKIAYSINNKKKIKNLNIDGAIFGLSFKSEWKRDYNFPQSSFHKVNIFNPNIELKNIFKFKNGNNFIGTTQISYAQDKLEYEIQFNKNKINIFSPKDKNINFNLNSEIQLKPFYFDGRLLIKNRKVEKIIDNLLSNLLLNDKNYLGNFNGKLKISFKELKNKLIKSGTMNFSINEKQIYLNKAEFELDKIGNITSDISFVENDGQIKFVSSNQLNIKNHIEFAKIFQVSTKKVKKIERIFFDLEKDIGETDFTINNIKINKMENKINSNEDFIIKNIQNLRSNIRNVID
mgnify:CR=1 FL=1